MKGAKSVTIRYHGEDSWMVYIYKSKAFSKSNQGFTLLSYLTNYIIPKYRENDREKGTWGNLPYKPSKNHLVIQVSHYTDHMDTAQSVNANAARKLASGQPNECVAAVFSRVEMT